MRSNDSISYAPVRFTLAIGLLVYALLVLFGHSQCKSSLDENEFTMEQFSQAMEVAKTSNQKLLLVFGADWCVDCQSLRERLEDHPRIASLVRENFLVMHVDVGRFDRNLKFAETFGNPQEKGIPALVILDPQNQGKILASTEGGEFSRASQMDDDSVYRYLSQFIEK